MRAKIGITGWSSMEQTICRENYHISDRLFLPVRASEQGNVIGLVSVYIIYLYPIVLVTAVA